MASARHWKRKDEGGPNPVWTVIYVAPSPEVAERLQSVLAQESIAVKLHPTGLSSSGGGPSIELLVPRTEAREAAEVLNRMLVRMNKRK